MNITPSRVALAVVVGLLLTAAPAPAAEPTVRPIEGGTPWMAAPFDVGAYGYSEREYLVSGTAHAYGTDDPPKPYVTRILVYRPTDPKRFSGNVDVEWGNVTAQFDLPYDFMYLYPHVMRRGDACVQVTTQRAGVCSAFSSEVCTPVSLKGVDPERYGALTHPGDQYAYDLFSQAAQAVMRPSGRSPLGRLRPKRAIAIGGSQSGTTLNNYIRFGADRDARVFDAFLVDADVQTRARPEAYRVPTMHLWGEDSAQPVKPTATPNHVFWSVAGAGHTDHWWSQGLADRLAHSLLGAPKRTRAEEDAARRANGTYGEAGPSAAATCAGNSEFPRRYAVDAALANLQRWARTGSQPAAVPPLAFNPTGELIQQLPPVQMLPGFPSEQLNVAAFATSPLALDHDEQGNALGGIRLPVVTVPVATYVGAVCAVYGISTPLAPTELRSLYPTHADYVARMLTAVRDAVRRRHLVRADAHDLLRRACASAIPAWGTTPRGAQPESCRHIRREVRRG